MRRAGVGAVSCSTIGTRENMGVLWEYLERSGGWWSSTRTALLCSRWRARAARARSRQRAGGPSDADRARVCGNWGSAGSLRYSPQAKGRVERSFGTAQDRLVKGTAAGQGEDHAGGQRVSGEGILAGVERGVRPTGQRPDGPASSAGQRVTIWPRALSHVEQRVISNDYTFAYWTASFTRSTASDRAGGDDAGPAAACGDAAGWSN